MKKPTKPKMSQFIEPETGLFDMQGYDAAMDAYEEELESYDLLCDDVYFFDDLDEEEN